MPSSKNIVRTLVNQGLMFFILLHPVSVFAKGVYCATDKFDDTISCSGDIYSNEEKANGCVVDNFLKNRKGAFGV